MLGEGGTKARRSGQVPSVCKADTGDPQLSVQGSLFYYLCSVIVSSLFGCLFLFILICFLLAYYLQACCTACGKLPRVITSQTWISTSNSVLLRPRRSTSHLRCMLPLFSPLPYLFHSSIHQGIKKRQRQGWKWGADSSTRCFMFELEEQDIMSILHLWLDGRRDAGSRAEEITEEMEVPTLWVNSGIPESIFDARSRHKNDTDLNEGIPLHSPSTLPPLLLSLPCWPSCRIRKTRAHVWADLAKTVEKSCGFFRSMWTIFFLSFFF